MPQVDLYAYVAQILWVVAIFPVFYGFVAKFILSPILAAEKIRQMAHEELERVAAHHRAAAQQLLYVKHFVNAAVMEEIAPFAENLNRSLAEIYGEAQNDLTPAAEMFEVYILNEELKAEIIYIKNIDVKKV